MTPISIKGWKKVMCAQTGEWSNQPRQRTDSQLSGEEPRRARSRHNNAETRMPCVQTGHGKSRRCNQPTSAGAESATGAAVWEMERAEPGGGRRKTPQWTHESVQDRTGNGKRMGKVQTESDTRAYESPKSANVRMFRGKDNPLLQGRIRILVRTASAE